MKARFRPTRSKVFAIAGVLAIGIAVPALAGPGGAPKSEHWGVITRNTIGSPVAQLRDGPYGSFSVTGPSAAPPFGQGSLGIEVANPPGATEKVDFGNEVDFYGDPVSGLTSVGYQVFQTQENIDTGGPGNMPNIRFEINPDDGAHGYTSMVWVPDPAPAATIDQWSDYIDATTTGQWYFTGGAGTTLGCNQTTMCTFADAKSRLGPAATIYTVAVGKGRDDEWVGAVDGLRINDRVYDFEATGVKARNAGH